MNCTEHIHLSTVCGAFIVHNCTL